jgi:hypothetical protein
MIKLVFLLWLPSAAFSAVMYTPPAMVADATYGAPSYAGESSWYSFWTDTLATAKKANDLGTTSPNAVTLPGVTFASAVSPSSGTPTAYAAPAVDVPAAIATNPEPGTWGLLTLGIVPILIALYRRRAAQ